MTSFEWDERKNRSNMEKHGVSFGVAQRAFLDPRRVIAEDLSHGASERRYFCLGRVGDGVMTVRFISGRPHPDFRGGLPAKRKENL